MAMPFPGMDPYLESPAYWRDFHRRFMTYWCDWLIDHLPDHYEVRIDERLSVVQEDESGRKTMLPDLSVSQSHPLPEKLVPETAISTLEKEPVTLRVRYVEEEPEAFLRIVHRPDAALIAVLELLSPTNKEGVRRLSYLEKRNELLREAVHLVELDLLLGGTRVPVEGPLPPGDYYAYVSRGDQRPECQVYGWALAERLPRIRLPLKVPDPDVVFDLPGLFAEAYRCGRYSRDLPYDAAPPVALSAANARWVRERIEQWKKAPGG
jgi:hypothetical protein